MEQERDWSSLPKDLLRLILGLLPWSSHPSFGAACRNWRSVQTPFFPAWVTPLLLSAADVGSTNLRFYSPYYHKNFEISSTLDAPGAKFCCAVGRHLTLCQTSTILEANLVTGNVFDELPPIKYGWFHFVVYDGGGAGAGRMFGVHTVAGPPRTAVAILDDDGEWVDDWRYAAPLGPDAKLMPSAPNTSPVIHGGSLYVLFDDGKLAMYDESRHRHDGLFEILDKPTAFGLECEDKYLFESDDGDLMAVLFSRRGTPVHVVRLNEQEMEWEQVGSLGGRALFTGTLTTAMRKTKIKWMENKVFLPRLYEWPDTIRVDIVDRQGELAFVPISAGADIKPAQDDATSMWSYELGSQQSKEFWDTEKVDYSIWVDFNTSTNTNAGAV